MGEGCEVGTNVCVSVSAAHVWAPRHVMGKDGPAHMSMHRGQGGEGGLAQKQSFRCAAHHIEVLHRALRDLAISEVQFGILRPYT